MFHTVHLEDKVTITESEAPRPCAYRTGRHRAGHPADLSLEQAGRLQATAAIVLGPEGGLLTRGVSVANPYLVE
jgi:hypothetical protein